VGSVVRSPPPNPKKKPSNNKHIADYSCAKGGGKQLSVFIDINEPYLQKLLTKAFQHPTRAPHFPITFGPGEGIDPIPLLPTEGCCSTDFFQWAEYERIDWEAVLSGKHGASSYCIRKGLSRKAQLAYYTHRHICKHPDSILKHALPKTLILDTWAVWDDDAQTQTQSGEGIADIIAFQGAKTSNNNSADSVNRRTKLDQCLKQAKEVMMQAEKEFCEESPDSDDVPMWILKPSSINKGAGIEIIHIYEELVDLCWSEPDIREW
jgi:hypothetical protein